MLYCNNCRNNCFIIKLVIAVVDSVKRKLFECFQSLKVYLIFWFIVLNFAWVTSLLSRYLHKKKWSTCLFLTSIICHVDLEMIRLHASIIVIEFNWFVELKEFIDFKKFIESAEFKDSDKFKNCKRVQLYLNISEYLNNLFL